MNIHIRVRALTALCAVASASGAATAAVFTVGAGGTHATLQSAIVAAGATGTHEIRVRSGFFSDQHLTLTRSGGGLSIAIVASPQVRRRSRTA